MEDLSILLIEQTEILKIIATAQLYFLGVASAVFVCFLLYKFFKLFY